MRASKGHETVLGEIFLRPPLSRRGWSQSGRGHVRIPNESDEFSLVWRRKTPDHSGTLIVDIYDHDSSLRGEGFGLLAGVDEAGRGPVAGPVVAAAVIMPERLRIAGLRDSKKVPERERETLFRELLCLAADIGVGIVGHEEIDRLNILNATRLAMHSAINDLRLTPDLVVIDAVTLPSLDIQQMSFFKAESRSASVAAASIIAKYVRDTIMIRYHDIYPAYNFRKNKGYCTAEHMEMIRLHGPSPIHRKSFRQVMSLQLPL